jgi:hypothetical protein
VKKNKLYSEWSHPPDAIVMHFLGKRLSGDVQYLGGL